MCEEAKRCGLINKAGEPVVTAEMKDAAGDLLAACREAKEFVEMFCDGAENDGFEQKLWNQLDRAIALAEGKIKREVKP